jgi:hypothetical protein
LIDSTFILLKLDEEEEGVSRPVPKVQVVKSSKVLGMYFLCAPIDLDKEVVDIEEITKIRTQPKTLRQLDISPIMLPTLNSWNLG